MKSWKHAASAEALVNLATGLALPASADTKLPMTTELSGIESILNVISNVSLSQSDLRANQTMLDVLDAKSELYPTAAQVGRPTPASVLASKKSPANRRQKAY